MSITSTEVQALTSIYHKLRGQTHATKNGWETGVVAWWGAYVTAAETGHPSSANVVGYVTEAEHVQVRNAFVAAHGASESADRLAKIDAVAVAMSAAVIDVLEPPEIVYGVTPGTVLSKHEIENWTVKPIAPSVTQEGDTTFHYDGDTVASGLHIVANHHNSKAGLQHWQGRGLSNARFDNCLITGRIWGVRSYRIQSEVWDSCTFEDIGHEHGWYVIVAGGGGEIIFRKCLWNNIPAQCTQSEGPWNAKRKEETPFPEEDNVPGGDIVYESGLATNVGWDFNDSLGIGGGASYPFSHAPAKRHVRMTDLHLDNTMLPESQGIVLVQGHGLDTFKREHRWQGGSVQINKPKRPVGKLDHLRLCDYDGVDFRVKKGGQNELHFNDGCEVVTIKNCTGDTRIVIDGQDMGSVSDGISYER